jgi:uncharacterized protein YyaL (SSP411 family)
VRRGPRRPQRVLLSALLCAAAGSAQALDALPTIPWESPLTHAASPYLRDHAGQAVHWLPWGDAAFATAAAQDRPVFLSIGYLTCHWCHVMARESFAEGAISDFLNQHYVCIAVDREEHPEVDQLYQAAIAGRGGWPLSVWLTPTREPFVVGTYVPADRFLDALKSISAAWRDQRATLLTSAMGAQQLLAAAADGHPGGELPADQALIAAGAAGQLQHVDAVNGGIGDAPKFPRTEVLTLFAHVAAMKGARGDELLGACRTTWSALARGAIRDQLDGGFHRYCVDAAWRVPHFEKMLYDQARLLDSYLEAWQLTAEPLYRAVAEELIAYVLDRLTLPDGGLAAAEDADSSPPGRPHALVEGAFYSWSDDELTAAFSGIAAAATPAGAALLRARFGYAAGGNVPPALDSQGELTGRSILWATADDQRLIAEAALPAEEARLLLSTARARLLALRGQRPRPARDDQVIAGWNGLMIGALAHAAAVLGDARAGQGARRAASRLRTSHWRADAGLARTGWQGQDAVRADGRDHAELISGLLVLHQALGDLDALAWAVELQDDLDRHNWNAKEGGYFSADDRSTGLLARLAGGQDGAEPGVDALTARNLLCLAELTDDDALKARLAELLACARRRAGSAPAYHPEELAVLADALAPAAHLIIVGDPAQADAQALLAVAHQRLRAHLCILVQQDGPQWTALRMRFPALVPMPRLGAAATAYLCLGERCLPAVARPTDLADAFARELDAH